MPFAKNAKATPTYFCSLPGALGDQMHPTLVSWLNEIRTESEIEVWVISRDDDLPESAEEWLEFLNAVFDIRMSLLPIGTSYAWHDEQAAQLRFNSGHFTREELPFQRKVNFVDSPLEIIKKWLSNPGLLEWNDLSECDFDYEEDTTPTSGLNVWAVEHKSLSYLPGWSTTGV